MNRREDPLLRQHRSRLLQLAEATNIKPGRGSGKRRGQRQSHGFGPSNGGPSGGGRVTLQDIVRSDPGYTPNIEHLVFPERKSSNPNLAKTSDESPSNKSKSNPTSSGRSRLAEVFSRHYSRGSSQDSSVTSRKNHLNSTSLDSGATVSHQATGSSTGATVVTRSGGRRWLSQSSQSTRQHSAEDGVRGGNVGVIGPVSTSSSSQAPAPALPPRRVSPADSTDISNTATGSRGDRGPNVSILHLRGTADPWEVGSQGSTYSIGSNKSQTGGKGKSSGNTRGSYTRGTSIPSLKRHDTTASASSTSSLKQHRQDSHGQVTSSRRRESSNSFLSSNSGTSGELFISGDCSRELSPVRWCDREVDGVYLGRSGWVQVQQRSLDENRRINYESSLVTATTGTLPLPRRATVKLADYHCNSEPGKCPEEFLRLDSQRPDYLALHGQDFDSVASSTCTSPHSIPESYSPPSITPIISPPPAFQDVIGKKSSSKHSSGRNNYGKAPFLPRSNAIVDSDIISPPPSPPRQVNWSSLPSSSRKSAGTPSRPRRQNTTSQQQQQQQQQQQYRMAQAKSLEDQSSTRRSQFVQRYLESSSSSSSSVGFRSLDSCVTRSTMPRLAENTDSSVEGYDDGDDEDDNPSSSLNLSLVSSSIIALNSSNESIRANGERISPNRQGRHHRSQQGLRRSPGSSESGKLSFNSPSSSSSSSSSAERQGRSPTPNPFRRANATRQHQSARTAQVSPESHQSRVRRSRSLQLPEKRSPGAAAPSREHSRESNEPHRVVVKISTDRGNERKRHILQNRKAQSTEDALNEELLRETEAVTEYLYGTRSRAITRNLMPSRFERREDSQEQRQRNNLTTYDVYFISSKQQQPQSSKSSGSSMQQSQQQQQAQQQQQQQQQQQSRRPKTLQRGATTPNANPSSSNHDFCISPEAKLRCNSSTCDFWPHCSQRETLYSPSQAPVFMKLSQSYPAHQRLPTDTGSSHVNRGSASSSPASLERMDDREFRERENSRKNRVNREQNNPSTSKYQDRQPKSVLKQPNRWSPLEGSNGNGSNVEKREHHRFYQKPEYAGSFEACENKDRKVSPVQGKNIVNRSPSGHVTSSSTSSSSSSDIWVTTSDRTVTKSPRNAKSSGASTPMEDAVIGSLKTLIEPPKDGMLSRPGSAPTRGEDSLSADASLDPHQRSLSLPKSFLTHNTDSNNKGSWQRGQSSQRSSPSPSRLHHTQEAATPHTAPVSPLHDQRSNAYSGKERRRIPGLSKAQRRIKASSTPALLDRDVESRQWSGDEEDEGTTGHVTTEHPLTEATIPLVSHSRLQEQPSNLSGNIVTASGIQNPARSSTQSQQESVLQKFRKSFSLRFHKKGSKESNESECPVEDNDGSGPLDEEEEREPSNVTEQTSQHKEDTNSDQKFRFGPLVWRSSKERKKGSKAARNAKCNSGDSGIQIEMVSGGALTGGGGGGMIGGGDSSESHDTDAQDETDSPPALRRRVADKSRPQSELVNQILIDKFKADLQSRTSRHQHVRRTNSDLGGQRLLQWDTRSGYSHVHNYRRMLSTPSPIKTRPPRLSPRHSSHDIVTLRSNAKGRSSRTNLRRSLSQPLGINQLSPLMRTKTAGARLPGGNVLSEDEQDGRGGTSDDEMMSDSESSIASLTDRKKSFEQTMDEEVVILAEAVWDHVAMEPEELAFRAGDVIEVLDNLDKDWWWGSCRGEHGWFPAAFVRLRVSQEDTVEDCLAAMASGGTSNSQLRRRTSVSLLSNEQVRTSVVRELVQTERDFVKILRDVAEGYIAECRRRTDMFTEDQIETIFINLEELLDFQSEFLKDLESRIDWNSPYKSCVGECFLNHRAGFRMYSEYCNSHPMATATLQELYQHNRYSKFFEACRLMRGLIEIPLDGYLLTPVQRICKYPLQLAELLKYTKADHPDYHKIQEALEAMRGVAVLINERKRRMESLEKLAAWQLRVEGWEGEDLIEVSSQLIYQGDAIRVTTGMWTNNITLFLFDHQLVYCKKDILKRNTYVYKGRIYLDTSEVIDVPDGKDHQLGVTVRHCLKVYSCVRDKWLLFCCRTAEEKRRWLEAMAEERRLVVQDRNDGLEFPAAAKQLARLAATRLQNRPPIKPRNKTYKRESAYEIPTMIGQGTTNSLGRKVGTWFTFGSSKKSTRLQPS
ncbi:rho guanine nucleotide exchange factor 3 isoform X2 [Osmia lignaria lignaria]|uniref:rho guanine nucleotide exchange factor 3 isoform X2 n=1 Tax=Osmia lignaria lignaria TaxID=1437193 RepID=UPI00402B0E8A